MFKQLYRACRVPSEYSYIYWDAVIKCCGVIPGDWSAFFVNNNSSINILVALAKYEKT